MSNNTPLSLVKFADADYGFDILNNETIRWNAPHYYTDPFEFSYDSPLGFDRPEFVKAVIKELTAMLFARDDPSGNMTSIRKAIKRWRMEQRFRSEQEAAEALENLLPAMIDQHYADIEKFYSRWRLYAYNARMLCLSDSYQDIGLWERCSDHHKGVAIRIKTGESHQIKKPLKVHYRSTRSTLVSLLGEVEKFTGGTDDQFGKDLESRFLNKSKLLVNQKEWRCIIRAKRPMSPDKSQPDGSSFEFRPLPSKDITAVYFGLLTKEETKEKYKLMLMEKYPKIKVYDACVSPNSYEIQFNQIELDRLQENAKVS